MRHCIICDSDFIVTPPAITCACGGELTRDVAKALPTKVLVEKRRRWMLFPELVKREHARRKFFAAEVAKAAQSCPT